MFQRLPRPNSLKVKDTTWHSWKHGSKWIPSNCSTLLGQVVWNEDAQTHTQTVERNLFTNVKEIKDIKRTSVSIPAHNIEIQALSKTSKALIFFPPQIHKLKDSKGMWEPCKVKIILLEVCQCFHLPVHFWLEVIQKWSLINLTVWLVKSVLLLASYGHSVVKWDIYLFFYFVGRALFFFFSLPLALWLVNQHVMGSNNWRPGHKICLRRLCLNSTVTVESKHHFLSVT